MSYTHYFNELRSDSTLASLAASVGEHFPLFGPSGYDEPVFSPAGIVFNGDDEKNEAYETFHIPGQAEGARSSAGFCSTGRYPYDDAVTAVLAGAVLLESEGWTSISSDGELVRWAPGLALLQSATPQKTLDREFFEKLESVLILPGQSLPEGKNLCDMDDLAWAVRRTRVFDVLQWLLVDDVSELDDAKITWVEALDGFGCDSYSFEMLDDRQATLSQPADFFASTVLDIARIWHAALPEKVVKEGGVGVRELLALGQELGVGAMLAAHADGVPLEDVIASRAGRARAR